MPFLLMIVAVFGAASSGSQSNRSGLDSAPANRTVTVGDVSIHYLGWGGAGEALIFLPAGCETAHVFGDVAPAFTNRFHVVGPTSRGCGQSAHAGPYDLDTQLRDIEGFSDALRIERAVVVGFSASGGKAIRFARLHPTRVSKLVVFDSVYSYIAPGLEEGMEAAIARRLGGNPDGSADSHRRYHQAWELGAWSAAMERDLRETYEVSSGGVLRPVGAPEWWTAFRADMKAGRYFETRLSHPTLMFFAVDLDEERIKQFDDATRVAMKPLAEETDRRRRDQIDEFRKNGAYLRVVEMSATAHYCFVHKPQEVIREMQKFLAQESPQSGPRSGRRLTNICSRRRATRY